MNQPAELQNNPDLIRVYDKYGREMYITREQWRTSVLPGALASNWNNPDQLYGIIVQSLNDGFRSDVLKAAEQLFKIDPDHVRRACLWGAILMEEDRLDDAEKVFRDFISRRGDDGIILTNLAKVYAKRKNNAEAERILWHALEINPNQDNGMYWYHAIHKERGGDQSAIESLHKIASLPGSWRAQLWLARHELEKGRSDEALKLYEECLSHVSPPVPTDMLMQMSGDLGNAGRLPEILQLCEPYFVPEIHGLQVGNNLIKAHLDLRQTEAAKEILNRLYALKRPDWQQTLGFWDTEIARARLSPAMSQKSPLTISILLFEGPVWLKPDTEGSELFPKMDGKISIGILGSAAETNNDSDQIQRRLADAPGRLSRSIPLFLAEQIELKSNARVQTFIPWMTQERSGGFVLSGVPWSDKDAIQYAGQGKSVNDYIITVHLKCRQESWDVELRLLQVSNGACIDTLSTSFAPENPETILHLGDNLLERLSEKCGVYKRRPEPLYQVPTGQNFSSYLLRLEQTLAVRCSSMTEVQKGFLSGEREIINGNIQLCLSCPQNVTTRLLLAKTLVAMKKSHPDILPEFKDKVNSLQTDHPLPEPTHGIIQNIFDKTI
jgi:tetratricopeptide (TPR) repeat protein